MKHSALSPPGLIFPHQQLNPPHPHPPPPGGGLGGGELLRVIPKLEIK